MGNNKNISRRNFIKGTAAGAAGLAATAVMAKASSPASAFSGPVTGWLDKWYGEKDRRDDAKLITAEDVKQGKGNGKIRYRWNSFVFNEIMLPNGKTIVIDPYWEGIENQYIADNTVPAGKWVKGADYCILTHTHGDHCADLPSILDYYPLCQVVVPMGGLGELSNQFGLGATRYCLLGVNGGDHLEFEDFTLDVYAGRHIFNTKQQLLTEMNNEILTNKRYQYEGGHFNAQSALHSQWGGLHFCNYMITTKPEGFKILVYGGFFIYDPFRAQVFDSQPDMMFYQAANPNLGNPYYGTNKHVDLSIKENVKTDEVASFVASVKPGLCMPSHQEKFEMEMLNYIAGECAKVGQEQGLKTQYFVPAHNTWYVFDARPRQVVHPDQCSRGRRL